MLEPACQQQPDNAAEPVAQDQHTGQADDNPTDVEAEDNLFESINISKEDNDSSDPEWLCLPSSTHAKGKASKDETTTDEGDNEGNCVPPWHLELGQCQEFPPLSRLSRQRQFPMCISS